MFEQGGAPSSITCSGPTVHLLGETAFVVCTEVLPGGSLVATNLFRREGGRFRLVMHQASPMPRQPPATPPSRRDVN
jgi:hypothetical protein